MSKLTSPHFTLKPHRATTSEKLFLKNLRVHFRKFKNERDMPKHYKYYCVIHWQGSNRVITVYDKQKCIPFARLECFMPVVHESIKFVA